MNHDVAIVGYVVLMGATIIGADVLFLRDHFWWRLATNIGIVVVFALVYVFFLRDVLK